MASPGLGAEICYVTPSLRFLAPAQQIWTAGRCRQSNGTLGRSSKATANPSSLPCSARTSPYLDTVVVVMEVEDGFGLAAFARGSGDPPPHSLG